MYAHIRDTITATKILNAPIAAKDFLMFFVLLLLFIFLVVEAS